MAKLTNKKLQEVKNNCYAVYNFDSEGRRCGTISGCNIVRAMEEAQNGLSLIYDNEIDSARVPKELFSDFNVESPKNDKPVWIWVMEVEAAQKQRATWQQVKQVFDIAKTWLKTQEVA